MRKCSIHLSFLLFNGPFALAIASKMSFRSSSFFEGKHLAKIGSKLKKKTAHLKEVLPDVISLNLGNPDILIKQDTLEKDSIRDDNSGAYKDRLSISLFLSEFKERTGDLSQLVRLLTKCRTKKSKDNDKIVSVSGGSALSRAANDVQMSWFDILGRKLCIYTGGIVSVQLFGTILSDDNYALFNEVREL